MIHTFQVASKISRDKVQRQGVNVWDSADIERLTNGLTDKLTSPVYPYTGINGIEIARAGDMYNLKLVVNPQSLITQQNTIDLFECTQDNVRQLERCFTGMLDRIGFTNFRAVTTWYVQRIDYAIEVTTPHVAHYVELAKAGNRPFRFFDGYDRSGSAYPQSKSATVNFYDKQDQIANTMANAPDFKTLHAAAQGILRLEVQCFGSKLKAISKGCHNPLRLTHFLDEQRAQRAVMYYYGIVVGHQPFYDLPTASAMIDASTLGEAKKRNLKAWLEMIDSAETIPDAKSQHNRSRATWYNYAKECRKLDINSNLIPSTWGIDYLPNPLA